jgi:hypothetical protein
MGPAAAEERVMSEALTQLMRELGAAGGDGKARPLPPVERWNPPDCGPIDIRIAADGAWFHEGRPIRRPAMVKLFSSVLRREGDAHYLVTPVEKLAIVVEDAPFQAVAMAVTGHAAQRALAVRTNVDDLVEVGPEHPLRFEVDADGGFKPYVLVRRNLWARFTRALTYELVDMAETAEHEGATWLGLQAGGVFHPIAPADAEWTTHGAAGSVDGRP